MADNVDTIRQFIQTELRGINTISMARVQEIDDQRRATVSLKRSDQILIDNVPVASIWARDGAGVVVPVERGDEGLLLHAKEPLKKQIQERGEQPPESEQRFELESAVMMPMLWLDSDSVPDHAPGELAVVHESGTELRLDDEGVHIGPELFVDGIAFTGHGHPYSWSDSGGSGTTDPPE